jgi:hypothetical protein
MEDILPIIIFGILALGALGYVLGTWYRDNHPSLK